MLEKKLSLTSYLTVGSMLFGLFFGAGNLIFPVFMGQLAGENVTPAIWGFLVTGVGLPFLGVIAIGVSKSSGLFEMASRVHPLYGYMLTVLLYLTIGPFFALPRLSTVSYEVGLSSSISDSNQLLALGIFSFLFYLIALFFSLNPSKIMVYIGKVLNPLFLVFLSILVIAAFLNPMGSVENVAVSSEYSGQAFMRGFFEGYNTMDALAALAFGIIVVRAIKDLGITKPTEIAKDTIKSGFISILLMAVIYAVLAFIGAMSVNALGIADNGGVALAQISYYYFGGFGSFLLAMTVTLACLKTAIGLITACAEIFREMFPQSFSYKTYVVLFGGISFLVANIGLNNIIALSIPVLMFLYPLAITLIVLAIVSPLFKNRQIVYLLTTIFTLPISIVDFLKASPEVLQQIPLVQIVIEWFNEWIPLFEVGMGWIVPASVGLLLGWSISLFTQPHVVEIR
ncbi:branched-chain amino acid transport system II carrier protein [Lacticigenium naphthae]|uniref:branched-chain amino acid transport system II carrier protein n=1 Tax=Lacticigenium naphthae TaxID=515351 RepID=UPI0003FDCA5F|nr:branched-chain amino acid transport system II carrier protein [Lacticigenium naphthae]